MSASVISAFPYSLSRDFATLTATIFPRDHNNPERKVKITTRTRTPLFLSMMAAGLLSVSTPTVAQQGVTNGQWGSYAGDAGSTKYSTLGQVSAANFGQLQEVWRWRSLDGSLNFEGLNREVSFGTQCF